MSIDLDHLIVPSKDRVAAARLLGHLLDVPWAEQGPVGPFSPVYVNDGLTIDFDQWDEPIPRQHYCFRVDQGRFDAILGRIVAAGIAYRSLPHGPNDGKINPAFGGSLVYWSEPDGHVWELLTVSYERQEHGRVDKPQGSAIRRM
ncbi:MAG: VOC family protein [Burkholderiales bacterium]|nr:VOC family protein [Burkholderiales bacterium]